MTFLKNLIVLAGMAAFFQSCAVEVRDDTPDYDYVEVTPFDDFVSYTIYDLSPSGRQTVLYSDCINLDDPFEDSGSVHIDTEYFEDDLYMYWSNDFGRLNITFENNRNTIYTTDYTTRSFRDGRTAEFVIGVGLADY